MSLTFSKAVDLIHDSQPTVSVPPNKNVNDVIITNVTSDSRAVQPGALFCCIRGEKSDGHGFVKQAEAGGAVALLCEHPVESSLPQIIVKCVTPPVPTDKASAASIAALNPVRQLMGDLAAAACDDPAEKLLMVGVTGTNGKTTTTWIIRSILNAAGVCTGLLGTIIESDGVTDKLADRTTPESTVIQSQLASIVKNAKDHGGACVMETSSHGLFLGRLRGTRFDVPVFTNLNPEHLDFHENLENYFQAKRLLFANYLKRGGTASAACAASATGTFGAVNADDKFGQRLLDEFPTLRGFALDKNNEKAFARVTDWQTTLEGTTMRVEMDGLPPLTLTSPLIGAFNVWNVLCAVTAMRGLRFNSGAITITDDAIVRGVASVPQVPGRLERHVLPNGASCFIDFAHTPAALKSVLSTVRQIMKPEGKLVSVFGHGGGRYEMNRPELGKFAASFADYVIVTMDNPRLEDPVRIARGIESGIEAFNASVASANDVPQTGGHGKRAEYERKLDRREAIYRALDMLGPDDVAVVTGKGPEPYLDIAGRKLPYSDAEVVTDWIRAHGGDAK